MLVKRQVAYFVLRSRARKPLDSSRVERRQPADKSPHFNDSFYFGGRDRAGTSAVFRLGFRPGQPTERWCDLVLPGTGHLAAAGPVGPDAGGIRCGGLELDCLEPARSWAVRWSGPMRRGDRTHDVRADLRFTADAAVVDFGRDGDTRSLAGYLARERWSGEWLRKLGDLRQVHYEQGGTLEGRVSVDGVERAVRLAAVRDHSFGSRDWRAMRRHAWLMALLDDGSHVNLSLVSYDFLPYMHSGYRVEHGAVSPVTRAPRFEDLPAENGPGTSFTASFGIGDGENHRLECRVEEVLEYSMDGQYRFFEGLAAFRLGSRSGVGICEFGRADRR